MESNNTQILGLEQVKDLINQGKVLVIAGDHRLMHGLPRGNWIGGTIPYFMSDQGGIFTKDKFLVTDFTQYVTDFKIKLYDEDHLDNIPDNYYDNGFNYILIPGLSEVLKKFAIKTELDFRFFYSPLVGWVTGADLNALDNFTPSVIDGSNLKFYEDSAIVLHVQLPDNLFAKIDIVNIFERGDGDMIIFDRDSFEIYDCYVNGENRIFSDYLKEKGIDKSHPLVADYNGVPVNVSIKEITDIFVETFAPVRKGVVYKFARKLPDYEKEFALKIPVYQPNVVSSVNCIYNYIFGKLEKKKLPYTGPFTFGEIAYILLNQTMVNLEILSRN